MLAAETEGSDRTGFSLDLGFFVGTVFTDRFVEGSSDATLSATDSSSKWRCSVIRQRVQQDTKRRKRGAREQEKKKIFLRIYKKSRKQPAAAAEAPVFEGAAG